MKRKASTKFSTRAAAAILLAAVISTSGWSQGESAQDKSIPTSKVERLNRAPVSKDILKVNLPRPIETVLPNGINLMILEDHRFPLITVQFDINGAGPMYEPAGEPGSWPRPPRGFCPKAQKRDRASRLPNRLIRSEHRCPPPPRLAPDPPR